jgi:radical SAM superfamily enzyme YgiQ (UPF0313 family)
MLAACLEDAGHSVQVVDLNNNPTGEANRLRAVSGSDAIGISLKSSALDAACRIAHDLGRRDLLCGGPHVTLDGERFLLEHPEFEIAFVGESEDSLNEVIAARQTGAPLESIKGIVFRAGNGRGRIVATPPRAPKADLDSFPAPDYGGFDSVEDRIRDYPLLTSRGCPNSCIYCCVGAISGKTLRSRSIHSIIRELAHARARFRSERFSILDDNFTCDLSRAKGFCQALIESSLDFRWTCPNGIRADRIDEEIVSLMKASGCQQVSIGIESLDEDVLRQARKGESRQDILDAVTLFGRHRIRTDGFFLVGLPGDTPVKSRQSLEQARRIGLDTAHWNMCVPYPGTRAWDWVNQDARVLADWRKGFHFGPGLEPTFETDDFRRDDMLLAYRRANIQCRNYAAFFDKRALSFRNSVRLFWLILHYDRWRLFSHVTYLLLNLRRIIRGSG